MNTYNKKSSLVSSCQKEGFPIVPFIIGSVWLGSIAVSIATIIHFVIKFW